MIAYQAEPWHDLFVAMAGAAAALAGLIFVAVSLNRDDILPIAALTAVAARSVSVLLGLVIVSVFGLAPGQDIRVLGTEILATGVLLAAGAVYTTLRAFGSETETRWKASLLAVSLVSTLPMVIGGASVLARAGGRRAVLGAGRDGARPGRGDVLRLGPADRDQALGRV